MIDCLGNVGAAPKRRDPQSYIVVMTAGVHDFDQDSFLRAAG